MKYQYCNRHGKKVKMNRIYVQEALIKNGKKQGGKTYLNYYWCKECATIYPVKITIEEVKVQRIEILEAIKND